MEEEKIEQGKLRLDLLKTAEQQKKFLSLCAKHRQSTPLQELDSQVDLSDAAYLLAEQGLECDFRFLFEQGAEIQKNSGKILKHLVDNIDKMSFSIVFDLICNVVKQDVFVILTPAQRHMLLKAALTYRDSTLIDTFLTLGFDPNYCSSLQNSLLFEAYRSSESHSIIALLITCGAQFNNFDSSMMRNGPHSVINLFLMQESVQSRKTEQEKQEKIELALDTTKSLEEFKGVVSTQEDMSDSYLLNVFRQLNFTQDSIKHREKAQRYMPLFLFLKNSFGKIFPHMIDRKIFDFMESLLSEKRTVYNLSSRGLYYQPDNEESRVELPEDVLGHIVGFDRFLGFDQDRFGGEADAVREKIGARRLNPAPKEEGILAFSRLLTFTGQLGKSGDEPLKRQTPF